MTKGKKLAGLLMLALVPPCALFVAFDYFASYAMPAPRTVELPRIEYLEFDPIQMWRLRPGYSRGEIRISPEGFRTALPPPSEGASLVYLIGGSSVFGVGMPEQKTVAYFLQQLSDRFQPEKRFRFINAGVTGYYSTQELIHLERHVLSRKPAIVIALTGRNDAFYGLHPNFQSDTVPYLGSLREQMGALDPYYSSLTAPSSSLHAVNWLRSHRNSLPFDWLRDFESAPLTYKPAATEVFLRNENSIYALLTAQGIDFHLFLQPTIRFPVRALATEETGMVQDFYLKALDAAYAELAHECAARLSPKWFHGFATLASESGPRFIDNVHLNEAGAREVARAVYDRIFGPPTSAPNR
jgi:lysophospholipase L1-like esterase